MPVKKINYKLDDGEGVLKLEVKEDTDIDDVRKALKAECANQLGQFDAVQLKLSLTTDGNVVELNPTALHSVITDGSTVVIHHPPYKEGAEWLKQMRDVATEAATKAVKETLKSISDSDSKSIDSRGSKRSRGSDFGHYSGSNRNSKKQGEMRDAVLKRDGKCIITGAGPEHALDCAHIVGLENIEGFPRTMHYHPSMGFLLRKDMHESYDGHEWFFQADGTIVKLRPNTVELETKITVPSELNLEAIAKKEELARSYAEGRCPFCWKKVGEVNLDSHRKNSCPDPSVEKFSSNDMLDCEVCGKQGIARYNWKAHVEGKPHLSNVAKKAAK